MLDCRSTIAPIRPYVQPYQLTLTMDKTMINQSSQLNMHYPLKEKIGRPDLLVGRQKEFAEFHKWIDNISNELSKSRVIIARRKTGKTVFVQRLFNQLWSQNGSVIPFFFNVPETKMWLADFAIYYYRTFASHVISFLERDEQLVRYPLTLDEIKAHSQSQSFDLLAKNADFMLTQRDSQDLMWRTAYSAPHEFASVYDRRVLVIIDEFQYLTRFIYPDQHFQTQPIESMPGSFHSHVESKVAPMLVTGSYISWILDICMEYLEAGRLSKKRMSPYLTVEEGLQAVYKYAAVYEQPLTNETALLLNQLCMADPFFISCVVQSEYEGKQLDIIEGVINTVNYEITHYESEMSETWGEYIGRTLPKINDVHSKHILLHLSKHNEREWTPAEVKEALQLAMSLQEIQQKLQLMVEADLLNRGSSDIRYQGLRDGTLYLVLRHRFEEEITSFVPDLRADFRAQVVALQQDKRRLQGMLNNLSGQMAEYQVAVKFRSQKRFLLSNYFAGVADTIPLNLVEVRQRVQLQREDGKVLELDVVAQSSDGRVVLVEVKKGQRAIGVTVVEDFHDKVMVYRDQHPEQVVLPAILALGGFTAEAQAFCETHDIGTAHEMEWL